ncbi:UDP-glucosyltransferase 2-like [Plodia interpunctella]|uniref:UDP-glucosyltransferase 2-like n=1 Tax=Plodia interpunctella TaxID=58824 RepID=UPI00236886FC|nr:UDP-glucosyltransferase 2-like [Plodia interpunctella]
MLLRCLCLVLVVSCVHSYKIMLMFPFPIKSLSILSEGFVKHLTDAGHEVMYITWFPAKRDYGKNFRQIDVSKVAENMGDEMDTSLLNITAVMTGGMPVNDRGSLQEFAYLFAQASLHYEDVRNLLQDTNEKFDVIIADIYETEVFAGLSVLYDCPMIWSYSMAAHWQVLRLVDERTNPAYTSDYLSANMAPLNFRQRLEELWFQIEGLWLKSYNLLPKEEKLYEEVFTPLLAKRGRTLPDYEDIVFNASLLFINEHHTYGTVPSIPLNVKPIGGYHIDSPAKPLPQDLQSLMDKSTDGVIYFSMGSTWQSRFIPKEVTEGLLKTFSEFKQTVIWKYEADLLNLPKNVHIVKWAPQPSILAHPNCHIFISHGGQMSSTEALHFGVAIIGVPIFFDQFVNINKAVAKGYAIKVPLTFNLPEDLRDAIKTMVNDPRYRLRAKELSLVYHDRPVAPGKELVHWVEHVIRTGGALHLRSPSLYANWYQKTYLDFIVIILIVHCLIVYVIKMVLRKPKTKKEKKH